MKKHIGLIALIAVVLSACSGSGGEENESTPPTVFKWKNEHSYSTDEFTIVAMCGSMYSGSVTKEEALEALTFQRITNPEIKLSKQNCAKLAYKVSVGQLKKQIEKGHITEEQANLKLSDGVKMWKEEMSLDIQP